MSQTLGFIGVGQMGRPMARNLLAAGYALRVYDLSAERIAPLEAEGAHRATSIADTVTGADVVILSLPGPPQVEAVMLSDDGVLARAAPGTTVIDTTTSSVAMVQRCVEAGKDRGIHVLESPVTNAIDMAIAGRLTLFVGGDAEAFARVRPILDVVSERIHYVGAPGNAATAKLLSNALWFVHAAAIGEALMLGAKAGIPLQTVQDVITTSCANSWVAGHDIPSIFAGHYDPSFTLDLCCKDLRLVQEIAATQGHELPMVTRAQERFELARSTYGGDAAELHVARLLEDAAGLYLRPPHGETT